MSASYPYYRPSLRTAAQAAFSQLSSSEQAVRQDSQLTLCRSTIEQTLFILNPRCSLARQLQDALNGIRRHVLSTLSDDDAHRPHHYPESAASAESLSQNNVTSCSPRPTRSASELLQSAQMDLDEARTDSIGHRDTKKTFTASNISGSYLPEAMKTTKKHHSDIDPDHLPIPKRPKLKEA